MRDMNDNQLKLKVNDTSEQDQTITIKLKRSNLEDVVNKTYLDTKLKKLDSHMSYIGKE